MIRHIFFYEQAYFVYLRLEICASQIFMAGNGSVINTIRLACLGKSNGQPFSLSLEGLFFHAPYSVSNQSNKPVGNLEMCEIRVNTHSDRHSPCINLLIFKKIYKDGNSFFRSFPPLAVLSEGALWWNPSACTIGFAVLLSVYTVLRYLFRFHPAIKGDEHERRGYLRYWKRHNFEDEII